MILKVKKLEKEDKYRKIFEYFNLQYDWKLNKNDLAVANKLYFTNYTLIDTIKDFNSRMLYLFSSDIKKNLMSELKLQYNVFNNSLTKLRKISLIEDNKLHLRIASLDIDKELKLTILFEK